MSGWSSNYSWRFFVLFFALTSGAVAAEPILIFEDGTLVGARTLDVEGVLYRVAFVDGSCVELLKGCDEPGDFPFDSVAQAETASAVLQAVLSTRGYTIRGCDPDYGCSLLTPIDLVGDPTRVRSVDLYVGASWCISNCATQYGYETPEPDSDLSSQADMVYVIWLRESPEVISWDIDPGTLFWPDDPTSTATLTGSFSYDEATVDTVAVNLTSEAGYMIRCLADCLDVEGSPVSSYTYNAGLKLDDVFIAYDQLDASDGNIERMLSIGIVGECELETGAHDTSIAEWICNNGDCEFSADRAEEFFFRTGTGTIRTAGPIPADLCPRSSALLKIIAVLKEQGKI
jgi:hypothetical protein